MATPAQVANDMAQSAACWDKRDAHIARTARDAAKVIRAYLAGQKVDGRTYGGLHRRLLALGGKQSCLGYPNLGYPNFERARLTPHQLRCAARSK